MSDRLLIFLLAKIIVSEIEKRTFVTRIGSNELIKVFLLLDHLSVGRGFINQDEKPISFRNLAGERNRLVQMLKKFLGRRSTVGASQFGGGKIGVEGDGLVKMRDRFLAPQFFRQITPRKEFLSRFVGLGRDRNLAVRRGRGGGLRGTLRFVASQQTNRAHREYCRENQSHRFSWNHEVSPLSGRSPPPGVNAGAVPQYVFSELER